MSSKFGLDAAAIERVFPFHFAFDRTLRLVQVGTSLRRLLPVAKPGRLIEDVLVIRRPGLPLDFDRIAGYQSRVVILDARQGGVVLRGAFQLSSSGDAMLFLGSPWLNSTADLAALGLKLTDFAAHDPIVDLLNVAGLKDVATRDARALAAVSVERERRLAAIVESAVEGIITIDAQGAIESANSAAEKIFGYSPGELRGVKVNQLMPEPHASVHDRYVERYIATGVAKVIGVGREVEGLRRDGSTFPMWLAVSEVQLAERRLFTGLVHDISDRKAAERALEDARLREVEVGARIQRRLLFGTPPDNLVGLEAAASTVPAELVGGDFFEFPTHARSQLDLAVGDVMGKSVPAALLGAACKGVLLHAVASEYRAAKHELPSPAAIVDRIDGQLCRELMDLGSFVTMAYARVDPVERTLVLVDCGHPPVLHRRASDGAVASLSGDDMPLGFVEGQPHVQHEFPIAPGDVLLFYSDGVTETRNQAGELFGEERLRHWLEDVDDAAPQTLLRDLTDELARFRSEPHPEDDLTLVAVRLAEPGPQVVMEISSEFERLGGVREWVRHVCLLLLSPPLDDEATRELELAVHEATANVIRHAYAGRAGQPIVLTAELGRESVVIELRHWGEGLRPESVSEPVFDGSRDGGFGLYLIGRSVDRVEHGTLTDGAVTIRLTKNRRPVQSDPLEQETI